jgi:hypothetical protein
MHVLKTLLVIALGLGSVWAARAIAPGDSAGLLTGVAYAQAPNDAKAGQPAQAPATKDPAVQDPAIQEQLARINAALANDGELKEFKPTEPLPADEAIEMSSEL